MKNVLIYLALAASLLPGAAYSQASTPVGSGFDQISNWGASANSDNPTTVDWSASNPLPADQAFRVQSRGIEQTPAGEQVVIELTPEPGYYIYRETLDISSPDTSLGKWEAREGVIVEDINFGEQEVFTRAVEIKTVVRSRQGETATLDLTLQGCKKDSICYPPMTRRLSVDLPAGIPVDPKSGTGGKLKSTRNENPAVAAKIDQPQAEDQRLADILGQRPAWQALGIFLGLGVILGLTPCVLPMVPILLGVVVGADKTTKQTAVLASSYVLAHAVVFAAMGAAAAWIGSGVAGIFQSAWMILPMAGLLAGLGIAMLLGKEIQMPAKVQSWAATKGGGGTVRGAVVMGGLSSLIIGPCVAPPLAGAVLYLAHSGDVLLGSAALFCLGLGMGMPMLLAATGMGQFLPRSTELNKWLTVGFGLMFVGLAVWLAMRVWPNWAIGASIAVVLLVGASRRYLRARQNQEKISWVERGWAQAAGAGVIVLGAVISWNGQEKVQDGPTFTPIATNQALNEALRQANVEGKTTVVEFYAQWCTACKDMERQTYSTPTVQMKMQNENTVAIKIDVTSNEEEDKKIMKRFGIIGPPATLFFSGTQEMRDLRLVGFEAEKPFVKRIEQAQCRTTAKQTMNIC